MKKIYNKPSLDITSLSSNDVITTSGIGEVINWNVIGKGEEYVDGNVIE